MSVFMNKPQHLLKHHTPFICPIHPAVDPVNGQSFWRVQTIRDKNVS